MNLIEAHVISIEEVDTLHVICFQVQEQQMTMISLGLNLPIKVGSHIKLGFKSLSVTLAEDIRCEISTSNQLPCVVCEINTGSLLCDISLIFNGHTINSIITKKSFLRMGIKEGDEVTALIKANDLSVLEVLS